MAYLRNIRDDHILVVGNGPIAIAWAAALRRLVPTVLVTPTPRMYDPYFAGALVAGYPTEAFVRDIDEFVPFDGYLVADPVDVNDGSATLRSPDGIVRTVGFKALLCTPSHGLYDGIAPRHCEAARGHEPVERDRRHRFVERLLESDDVTVVGPRHAALSLALELAARSGRTRFRFLSATGAEAERIDTATTRLWRRMVLPLDDEFDTLPRVAASAVTAGDVRSDSGETSSDRTTVVSLDAPAVVAGGLDRFSRIGSFERVFGLSDEALAQPRGALFANLLTCAYATGRFPLTFHRHRSPVPGRRMGVYASTEARSAFTGIDSLFSRRRVRPLERRMRALQSFLMQLQVTKEVATV